MAYTLLIIIVHTLRSSHHLSLFSFQIIKFNYSCMGEIDGHDCMLVLGLASRHDWIALQLQVVTVKSHQWPVKGSTSLSSIFDDVMVYIPCAHMHSLCSVYVCSFCMVFVCVHAPKA